MESLQYQWRELRILRFSLKSQVMPSAFSLQ